MQYRVSVNGKAYDVVIELVGGAVPVAPAVNPVAPIPVAHTTPVPVASVPAPIPVLPTAIAEESILCPMPGTIWQILTSVGESVSEGQVLIVLEAMKMENEIVAPRSGVVKQILVTKDAAVETGDILVVLS